MELDERTIGLLGKELGNALTKRQRPYVCFSTSNSDENVFWCDSCINTIEFIPGKTYKKSDIEKALYHGFRVEIVR